MPLIKFIETVKIKQSFLKAKFCLLFGIVNIREFYLKKVISFVANDLTAAHFSFRLSLSDLFDYNKLIYKLVRLLWSTAVLNFCLDLSKSINWILIFESAQLGQLFAYKQKIKKPKTNCMQMNWNYLEVYFFHD